MKKISLILITLFLFNSISFADFNVHQQRQKQMQIKQELLDLKKDLENEDDIIRRAELENKIKIKELENDAQEKIKNWIDTNKEVAINQIKQEAVKVNNEAIELTDKFENLMNKNKSRLIESYKQQVQKACSFKKGKYETSQEYTERIDKIKQSYEQEKIVSLSKNEDNTLKSMIVTTEPFIERLKYFQAEKFYDKDGTKAEIVSLGDFNVDDFIINIKFNGKTYSLNYDFSGIGKSKAELMYQTPNQFVIEPLFSINGNIEKVLVSFNVKHLGMKTEKLIDVLSKTSFKGIKKLSKYRSIYIIKNTKYKLLSAGGYHTIGLKKNGTLVACGNNDNGQCNISKWKEIVSASAGNSHTVGLKKDGTVIACGNNYYGQCNVLKWEGIIAISAGKDHTLGLKEDGTVVAVGNNVFGQCDVNDWDNIVAISAGGNHSVGVKEDGTVIACGYNKNGQCNVKNWKGIISVSAGEYHTVGLKKNGTTIACGNNDNWQCNISNRENIIEISATEDHSVGLRSDGNVIAFGNNEYGQCNVDPWGNILEISAGLNYTIGLRKNGTIIAVGNNYYRQCDIEDWNLFK